MATQTGGFIREQNLNVRFDVAPSGLKTNKPQKNGGLGGRKALGDISNSRMASALQPPNKLTSKKVLSVAKDFDTTQSKSSFGAKTKVSTRSSGRKALADLTNSVKPHGIQDTKKTRDKKLSAFVEEPLPFTSDGTNEHLLHDHGECIKAQEKAKALDLEYFLKPYGLGSTVQSTSPPWVAPLSAKMKPEKSPVKFSEMDEVFELLDKDAPKSNKFEVFEDCPSPTSPPRFNWDSDMILSLKSP